ncbi:hypothetical protein [Ferruginibacter sp.]|nr:hypothetical protein [Ferruginibacter sp.]
MTDLCPGEEGVGPILLSWIDQLKQKGVEFSVSITDSTENIFFDAISIKEEVLSSHKTELTIAKPPSPPPPPPLSSLIGKNKKALTILATGGNKFYYYNGSNCTILNMVDLKTLKQTIRTRVKTTKKEEIIIVLKSTQEATFKSILDILDEIVASGTPKYHYAEEDITETELNCIKNYKNK